MAMRNKAMKISLLVKNKLGFRDGSIKGPKCNDLELLNLGI